MDSQHQDFLKILSDYQGIIHKVNVIYFTRPTDREDNFQEVVYQLWKSFPSLKDKTKIGSWMYAIAINTSISKIRKDSRFVSIDFGSNTDPIQSSHTDNTENKIDAQQLMQSIQALNEIDKSIILLYMEDYSYDQIAKIVGISSTNVGVKINRIKKQLRKHLTDK